MKSLRTKRIASAAFQGLLSNPDIKAPSPTTTRKISDYAQEHFGSTIYAPWLMVYTTYRGGFREGWIPENFFHEVVVHQLNGKYHMLDNARTLQAGLLGPDVLPDILHFISGDWKSVDGGLLNEDSIVERLFDECDEVCIKTQQSSRGRGVSFATRESFDLEAVKALGDFVVQKRLRQHDFFSAMFPGAVATIRVATGKRRGARPTGLFSNLRLGRGSDRAVSLNQIKVPIVDSDGTLDRWGTDGDWKRHAEHPDTGFRFEGARIPDFQKIQGYCVALHERLPQFGLIAWDVAADTAGDPRIMEFNTGFPGIKFGEMSLGPCFEAFDLEQYAPTGKPASH